MKKSVDIMVLGATGYTGKCTVNQLVALSKTKYPNIRWGIAGRSKEKLQKIIEDLNKTNFNINNLTIVEIDIKNEESLKKMLQDVKVLVNCTGPNIELSPPIVKACIETGTHYVDISAEAFHILKLYQDYHKAAEDANVLVIPACGYAVMPVEAAMLYLERQFQGNLHSVESYSEIFFPSIWPGVMINNGTWTSTVHVMETFKDHLALQRKIFPMPIEPAPEEMKKSFFHRNNGLWWMPYPGPENVVIEMSQMHLYEKVKKKPVHFKAYTRPQTFFHFIVVPVIFMYYYLCYFKWFRKFLINFPRLCTIGFVGEKGPTYKTRQKTKYCFTLNGKGWDVDDDRAKEPTKTLSVKVSGRDPGYDTTAIAIIISAITILKEDTKMPKGGVVMPGAAFYKTEIVDRLMNNNYKFEVLER